MIGPRLARILRPLIAVAVTTGLGSGVAEARAQTVEGRLLERGIDRPVDLGLVLLLTAEGDSVDATLTDVGGNFRLESATPGDFLIAASGLGVRPTVASSVLSLGEGASMSIDFRVDPVPLEIGGLEVLADAPILSQGRLVQNGFVDRVLQGRGRFVIPSEIENSAERSVSALLQRTGRVTTQPTSLGDRVVMLGTQGYCAPAIYIDGARVSGENLILDQVVPINVVDAMEVYRSEAEAPPEFAGGLTGCGVIAVWTKTR